MPALPDVFRIRYLSFSFSVKADNLSVFITIIKYASSDFAWRIPDNLSPRRSYKKYLHVFLFFCVSKELKTFYNQNSNHRIETHEQIKRKRNFFIETKICSNCSMSNECECSHWFMEIRLRRLMANEGVFQTGCLHPLREKAGDAIKNRFIILNQMPNMTTIWRRRWLARSTK